jgi:HSP20 family protein
MNLVTWDPYRELGRLPSHFNRVLGALAPRERDEELSLGAWIPPVDIMEEKDRILLTAELPGFKESDVEVQMEGNILTLRGERKSEVEREGRTFHRMERSYGQFVRSFTLPNNVDREHIKANFANGLLQIELPKREESKPRQIKIGVGDGNGHKKEAIDVKGR